MRTCLSMILGCDAEPAEQDTLKRGHSRMFRGRGMRSRMRGHHWRFRPKTEDNCIDTEMEGSNTQVAEQEKFGGGQRFLFRGRGVWNRMHGHYRKNRRGADGDEVDNHSGEEMEAWNAQVAEEEKLLSRGRLISFPGTGAFPDTCEDKTPVPNIQEGGDFSDTEWEGSSSVSHEKPLVASRVLMSLIGSYASDQSDNEGDGESAEIRAPPVPLTASNSCNGATSESLHLEDAAVQNDSDGAPEEVPIVFKECAGEPPALPSALSTAQPTALPPTIDGNGGETHHPSKKRRHRTRPAKLKGVENTTEMACDNTQQRPVATRPRYPQRCRPTLLDKLLREEIRHERNVILQCINHIVKHRFFSGHSASKTVESAAHSPCDNRVKIIAKCISHIVNCDLLGKDNSANTDNALMECS